MTEQPDNIRIASSPLCHACRRTYHAGAMICWQCGSVVDRWQYAKELLGVGLIVIVATTIIVLGVGVSLHKLSWRVLAVF